MLDMRDLRHGNFNPKDVISDQHYLTAQDSKVFEFGNTTKISQDELVKLLKRLLYIDNEPSREVRNIILVGQGFKAEILVMKALGIELCNLPSVVEIFDTEYLAYEVIGTGIRVRLSCLCEILGISRGKGTFHNAGNDASYTLRVMLLLAVCRYDVSKLNKAQQSRMEM